VLEANDAVDADTDANAAAIDDDEEEKLRGAMTMAVIDVGQNRIGVPQHEIGDVIRSERAAPL